MRMQRRSWGWFVWGMGVLVAVSAAAQVPAAEPARAADAAPTTPRLPVSTGTLQPSRYFSVEALETAVDPNTYVLGPHDILALMLMMGEVKLERLPVLPEGVVLVPGVGPVPAAGRTLQEFRDALRRALAQRYRDFEVHCYLAEARQFRVSVIGEVREPGSLVARSYERVSEVIERAGGFTDQASRRVIELRDALGNVQAQVDLDAYYRRGEVAANPRLAPGQVVFVPVRRRSVEVSGAVAKPGTYELLPGEGLRALLDVAGGPLPQAALGSVSVDRIDAEGVVQVEVVDLATQAPGAEDVVRVTVPSRLLGKGRVFVTLPDGRRETLYLSAGETVRTLLPRVIQIDPNASRRDATLVSYDSTGARRERRFDMARVLAGSDDAPVHDGDAFALPPVPDQVYVSGLVARPGRFTYRADWAVNEYIGEAGGTAPGGNRDHVTIVGTDGETRSAERQSSVGRGETIHVNRSTSSKFAVALGLITSVSALVVSVVALVDQ